MSVYDVFGGPDEYRIQLYISLLLISCAIGIIASVLTLLVVNKMQPMTSHVYLVFFMTLYQLAYNIAFFLKDGLTEFYVKNIANFFTIYAGMSTSFISIWISFAMYSTVIYRKKFDIYRHILLLHASYTIPSLTVAITFLLSVFPENDPKEMLTSILMRYIYNIVRYGCILANFVLIFATARHIYGLYGGSKPLSNTDIAVITLCKRMIFYPIIQSLGRVGSSWFELVYGLNYDPSHPPQREYAAMLCMAIVSPIVSLGYLIVFLWMQPHAWEQFQSLVGLVYLKAILSPTVERNTVQQRNTFTSEETLIRGQYPSTLEDSALESELIFDHSHQSYLEEHNATKSITTTNSNALRWTFSSTLSEHQSSNKSQMSNAHSSRASEFSVSSNPMFVDDSDSNLPL